MRLLMIMIQMATVRDPFFLFHRFIGHGNRDDSFARTEFDNVLGLQGTLDIAAASVTTSTLVIMFIALTTKVILTY